MTIEFQYTILETKKIVDVYGDYDPDSEVIEGLRVIDENDKDILSDLSETEVDIIYNIAFEKADEAERRAAEDREDGIDPLE